MAVSEKTKSTFEWWIQRTWLNLGYRTSGRYVKFRTYRYYKNVSLCFSRAEFAAWAQGQRTVWDALKCAGLRPSLDRINPGDYTLDNLQIISVNENSRKADHPKQRLLGLKEECPVVLEFCSQYEAARFLGCSQGEISRALLRNNRCRGWKLHDLESA